MKKRLDDLLISPLFVVPVSLLLGQIGLAVWKEFSASYIPEFRLQIFSIIYAALAIFITSKIISHFLNTPTQYVYAVSIVVNSLIFGLLSVVITVARIRYLRPDLLTYYIVSTFLILCLSWYYEKHRKFVFYLLCGSRPLSLINNNNIRTLGTKLRFPVIIRSSILIRIDGLVVDFSRPINAAQEKVISDACIKGAKIFDRNELIESIDGYVPYEQIAQIATSWRAGFEIYAIMKRIFDVVFALILFPIFLPIILLCIIFIIFDSPGFPIFIQDRVGLYGRVFKIYKLRTMYVHDQTRLIQNASDNDPRITRVGKVLRRFRLDELPQIYNVFIGDMSWIGPRPETIPLTEKYVLNIPLYNYRTRVRPGVTGWAAVQQGYVGTILQTRRKLQYDLYYIKNYSFEIDAIIFIKTIFIIIFGRGSN